MLRDKDKGDPAKKLGPVQSDELSLDDLDKVVGGNAPATQGRREDEQPDQHETTMSLATSQPADPAPSRPGAWWRAAAEHQPTPTPTEVKELFTAFQAANNAPSSSPSTDSGAPWWRPEPPTQTPPTPTTPTPTEGTGTTPTPTEGTGTTPTPTEGTGTTPTPTEGTGTTLTPTEGTGTTPTPTEGTGTTPTPTEGTGTTPTPTEGTDTTPAPTEGTGTTPTPTEGTGTTPTPTEGTGTTPTPTEGTGATPSPTDDIISEFAAGHADAEQAAAAMVAMYADPSQFGTWIAVRDDLLATLRDLAGADTLTPRQLADLCANLIADGAAVVPQPVPGIPQPDEFVRQTVQYVMGELIYERQVVTLEQAISALVAVGANEPSAGGIFEAILAIGNASPGMVTDRIADAVTSGEITGAQAATVLATMAVKVCGTPYFQPWTEAVSAELRDLVTQNAITPSECVAATVVYVSAQTWLSGADRAATLAGLADISAPGMTSAVADQLTTLIAEGRFDAGTVVAGLHAAVDGGGLGRAQAVTLLGELAVRGDAGMEAAVAAELPNIIGAGLTKPQAMEILESFAADVGPAAQAVIDRLVAGLSATIEATPETIEAINALLGPAGNWGSWRNIGEQVSSRIEAGEISAAEAVALVRSNVSPYSVTGVLVAMAVAGDATVDAAVIDALRVLKAEDSIEARDLLPVLVVAPVGAGADLNATVAEFIAAGLVQPAEIVNAWAVRMNGITPEQNAMGVSVIAGLIESGALSVSEVIDGVKNASALDNIDLIGLAKLSTGSPALLEAAAGAMLSYLDRLAPGNLTATALQSLPGGQAVALLAELADSGVAGMARAVGVSLTNIVSYGLADAGTVIAELHDAAASGALGGAQAVAVLGEFAMRSDAAVQAAVATELASVLGAQHVTREQAIEILEAIAADAAPVHRAVLTALVAGLPAPAPTQGIDTTPNPNLGNGSTPTPTGDGTPVTPTEGTGTTPTPTEGTGTTPTPTEGTGTTPSPTEGTGTMPTPTEGEGSTPQVPAAAAQFVTDFVSGTRSAEQLSRIVMELMSAGMLNQQDLSNLLEAVADGHAVSAEQATALFANLAVDGDGTIRDLVRGPMLELIRDHGVTVGQAVSAIAAAAGDANVWTQYAVAREVAAVATATGATAGQVADMIGAAIGAQTVSDDVGLGLLAGLAGLDASYKTAVTTQVLDLIQRGDLHPDAVVNAIQQAVLEINVTTQDAFPMLLAVADAAPGARELAVTTMRYLVSQGFATEAQLTAAVNDAVAGGVISSENARAMFGDLSTPTPTEGTGTTPSPTEGTGTTPTEGTGTTPTPTEGTGTTPTPTEGTGTTPTPTEGNGQTETPAYTPPAGADVDDVMADLAAGTASAEQAAVAIIALYGDRSRFDSIYEVEENLAETIRDAVASDVLTGSQAADLLANLAAEGDYNMSTAARGPMAELISDGKITATQAVSALIKAGADEPADGSQYGVTAFIGDIASRFQVSGAQVADLVGAAVASNAVTGQQAAVFFCTMIGVVNWVPDLKDACSAEMRDLLAQNEITPAQFTGAIGQVWTNWNLQPTDAMQMLLTAAEQSPAVRELVGAEIAAVIAAGGYVDVNQTATEFSDAVAHGRISADHALAILADLGATGTVGDQISDAAFATMAQRGVLSGDALITYFHDAVANDSMSSADAIASLLGLANQNAALLKAVGEEIATQVAAGELTAAQAAAAVSQAASDQTISNDKAVSILLSMSVEGNAAVDAAVIAELRAMNGQGMLSMWDVATGLLNTPWPAGTDLSETIADLVAADLTQPSTIVYLWTVNTFSQTSNNIDGASPVQVANGLAAIATMVEDGVLTAQAVVDAVKSAQPWNSYDVAALTKLAVGSPALMDAAAAGMLSYLSEGFTPADLVASVHSRSDNGYLNGAQAAALLTELAESTTPGMAKAVAAELTDLISRARIDAGTVIAGLHDAASGGELSGAQAVALLGELAIQGNSDMKAAVAAELATVVGAHHVTDAQATEILQGIASGATSAQQAVIAELVAGLGGSIDRAQLIFDGISANANAAQLDAAADQLAQLVSQGGATAAQVVDDISEAVTAHRLTPVQAATLLADLAGNGGAVAAAAGAELGDLLSARTISTEQATTAVRDAVAAGGLTGNQAMALLIAAGADNDSRGLAVNVLYDLRGGTIPVAGVYDALKAGIAGHTLTGTQAFEFLADLGTWYQYSNPAFINGQIAQGLGEGTFTAADVEAAAIHRVIPVGQAVGILAGIAGNGDGAAIDGLVAMQSAGIVTAAGLIESVRNAVGADQNLRILMDLSMHGDAAMQTAATAEFAYRLYAATPEQFDTMLQAAAISHRLEGDDAVVLLSKVLGAASGSNVKAMVEQELVEHVRDGVVDLGHMVGVLAGAGQIGGLAVVLSAAAGAPGADAAQVMDTVGAAVTAGTLTADQALTLLTAVAGRFEAGVAADEVLDLINAGVLTRDDVMGRLSSATPAASAVALLVGLMSESDDMVVRSQAGVAILSQIENGRIGASAAVLAMAHAAVVDDPDMSAAAGAQIARLVAGNKLSAEQALQIVHANAGEGVLETVASMATASGSATMRMAAFNDIAAMVANGQVTALQAIVALGAAADAAEVELVYRGLTADLAAMQSAVATKMGELMNAPGQTPADVIANIHAAVTAHAIDGAQAATILGGMILTAGTDVLGAIGDELAAMVAGGHITAAQAVDAVGVAVAARPWMADRGVSVLANLSDEPGMLGAVGAEAASWVRDGLVMASVLGGAVVGTTFQNVLTNAEAVAMLTAIAVSGTAELKAEMTGRITWLVVDRAAITVDQAAEAISQAGTSGNLDAAGVVAMLAGLPVGWQGTVSEAVVDAIAAQVTRGSLSAADLAAAVSPGGQLDLTLFARVAADCSAAVKAGFGDIVAMLVQTGTRTAAQVVGTIHDAMDTNALTGEQGLLLLAHTSAAVANRPGASDLNQPIHAEIQAMIANREISDVRAIELLRELSANGSPDLQAAAGAELSLLMADQQILINVAGRGTDAEVLAAAARLAEMVNQGLVTPQSVLGDILEARNTGHMTSTQAMEFLTVVIGAGTADGWAVNTAGAGGATNWLEHVDSIIGFLCVNDFTAEMATDIVAEAVTAGRLTGDQAVTLLAGCATQAALLPAVAAEIASLIARGDVSGSQAAADILAAVGPQLVLAEQAVKLLALAAGSPGVTPDAAEAMGAELHDLTRSTATASQLMSYISWALHDGADAAGVGAMIAGYAGQGDVAAQVQAATAIAQMIQSGVLSSVTVHAIATQLPEDKAVVVLAAMTENYATRAMATSEIAGMVAEGRISAAQLADVLHDAAFADGQGLTGLQVITALAVVAPSEAATEASALISAGKLGGSAAIAVLAEVGAGLSGAAQANLAQMLGGLLAASGGGIEAAVASMVQAMSGQPVDAQIALLAAMSDTTSQMSYIAATMGIAQVIANGADPDHVIVEIRDAFPTRPSEAVELLAGVASNSPQLMHAAGAEIARMIGAGFVSATDAANAVTNWSGRGYPAGDSITVLGALMAAAPTPAIRDVIMGQAMYHMSYALTPAAGMQAIADAVEAGTLPTAEGLTMLMRFATAPINTGGIQRNFAQVNEAGLDALVALLSEGDVSPEQFLRAAGLQVSDSARLLSAASRVFGELIEDGHFTAEQVVAGVQNAVEHGALTAAQSAMVLTTLGDAGQEQATAEIGRLISSGEMTGAEAATMLAQSAAVGTPEDAAAAADQLGRLVADGHITADEAKSALGIVVGPMPIATAVLLLAHAAGSGDASMQVAAGELIRELQGTALPNELMNALRAAVNSDLLSTEDAVLMIVGASQFPGDSNNSPARIIGELVLDGRISPSAVMTLIHDAVEGGAMTADEALKAIPFVAQGSINDAVRAAAREGVCMLVRDGLVTGDHAVEVLMSHSRTGSAFFQSLIGGEIAALGAEGLVDMASLVVAIAGLRATGTGWDASFNVMIGMSMIGPVGEKLVADTMTVMIEQTPGMAGYLINAVYEATASGRIAPANGTAVLVHLAAQGDGAVDGAVRAAYVNLWDQQRAAGLMGVAGEGDAAVQAVVGELLVARGSYDIIRQQLRDAVTSGVLTAEEAVLVMLHAEEAAPAGGQGRRGIEDAARWLGTQMEPEAFFNMVLAKAVDGDAGLQVAAGAIIRAGDVMSVGAAATEILEKITWTFMPDEAMAVIAGMTAVGGVAPGLGEAVGKYFNELGGSLTQVLDPLQGLVAQGLVPAADAVRIMVGMSNTVSAPMQSEVGDALAELVADGRMTAADLVSTIKGAALTLEQKLDVMANTAVHGDAVLRGAVQTGLWQLASNGTVISNQLVLDVIEALVNVAAGGNAALQGMVGTQLGVLATYNSGAVFSSIAADVAAGTMTGTEASAVFSGMAATGNAAVKEAAADALAGLIDQGRVTPAEVVIGLSAGLAPDQAIDALVALVQYGNDAVDAVAMAELSTMLTQGRVTVDQVTAEVAGLKLSGQIYGSQVVDLLASLAQTDYPGMAKAAAQAIIDLIPLVERLTPERAREFIEAFGYAEYAAAYMQYNLWYAINDLGEGAGGAGAVTVLAHLALLKPELPEVAEECSEAVTKVVGSGRVEITAAIESLTTVAASGLPHAADVVADLISKISYNVEVQQLVGAIGTKALDGTMTASQALNLLTSMEGNPALVAAAGAQLAMLVEHGVLTGSQVASQIRTMLDAGLASAKANAFVGALDGKPDSYYDNLVRQEANSVVLRATRMLAGLASSSSEDLQNAAADALMGIAAIGRYTVPLSNNVQLTVGIGGAVNDAYRSGAIAAEAMVQIYAELGVRGVGSLDGAAADVVRAIRAGDLTIGQMVDVLAESYADESGAGQDHVADLLAQIVIAGGATIQQVGTEIHEAIGSGAMTFDQGVGMLACMADNAVDRGAIGRVLGTYIDADSPAGGSLQIMGVIQEVVRAGDLDVNAATAMVGGFISGGADVQIVASSFSATVLEHWGVPHGSAQYDELAVGLAQAVQQVSGMAHGTGASAVIANLTAYAEQNDVPVDLLLSVVMHGASGLADAAAARTALANEIRGHLQDGAFQNDMADLVAAGHLTMAMAEDMVGTVAGSFGALATTAIDLLHVEVAVATFAEQIMDGEKTAQQAIDAIVAAAGTSRYTIDLGLAHLIDRLGDVPPISADFLNPEMSGATPQEVAAAQAEHQAAVAAAAAARDEVMQEIGARTQTGVAAEAWAAAVNAGVLPAQVAIDQLYDIVGTGRDAEGTYLLQCVGLARLMEASSNDIKNAIKGDMSYLERTLTGLATLISVDPPGFATHQALSFSLATEFVRLGVAGTPTEEQTERASALGEQVAGFFSNSWWLMRDGNAVANTFGHSIALSAAHAGGAETFESYLSFGAEVAAQGIPGVSAALNMPTLQGAILNMAFTGAVGGEAAIVTTVPMPEWLISGMGNYAPNSFVDGATGVGMSPAMIFTAVNIASKAIPKLIEWFSVSTVLGQNTTGAIVGTCGLVSAACDVVSNSISGMTREAAMNTYRSIVNAGEVYNNLQLIAAGSVFGLPTSGEIADLEHNALQLAQALTPLMYGGADLDAMIAAGVNTAEFTKDLLTGNFSNLEDSAAKMGLAFLDTVIKNHYVQITTEQMYKFISVCGAGAEDVWDWYMAKSADPDPRMVEFARGYIGLFTGDTWVALGDKLDSAFSSIGDEVESWFN